METFYGVAYLILFVSFLIFFFVPLMYSTYVRSRRKGHSPPVTTLVLASACGLSIAVAALLVPRNLPRVNVHLVFFYGIFSPLLMSIAFSAVAVVLLPTRKARVFGARNPAFPFFRVGQVIVGLSILLVVATIIEVFWLHWLSRGFPQGLSLIARVLALALAFLTIGRYFFHLERRVKAPPVTDLLQADRRAPVLYLRAFRQESQFFVIGPKYKYAEYATGLSARLAEQHQNVGVTFEGYFARDLTRLIGPFLALGSPEDYIPPEGAARTYSTDTDWMKQLRELAAKAACILVQAGKSANLRWEFEYLRKNGLQQKLFVITPPRRPAWTKLAYTFYRLLARVKGIPYISWTEFVEDLGSMGYELSRDDPGAGAVVGFDQDGKGILLTKEADLPSDYVGPISAWIGKQEIIDRGRGGGTRG